MPFHICPTCGKAVRVLDATDVAVFAACLVLGRDAVLGMIPRRHGAAAPTRDGRQQRDFRF